jgi:cysteinyl-tRNA synthetase
MEDFTPSGEVAGMYSCGPTVYAFPHLGNMRPYVFADTLRRAFRWQGIKVRHVVNITDVGHAVADTDAGEDKLEVAAAREHRSVLDIAEFYTDAFFVDIAALNILPADEYPRASAYVEQMIEFAAELEKKGFTYQLPSGLYFDTARDPHYGELAQMSTEGQLEAARLEYVAGRRRKTDFALWRAEEPGQRRVMRWDSPWGWGAPGWHLECSVMSIALLGPHFDLHTGGVDHRELHHVNEIAQSEAYLGDGKPWVQYWLHNEFLQLGAAKMAKSAGGAPRLADLTEAGYHPMAYRLFLLGGHYRSQLDFTTAAVDAAQATLRRLVARVQPLRPLPPIETLAQAAANVKNDPAAERLLDTIDAAIAADLSTPRILAALQEALRDPAITTAGQRTIVAVADALLGLGLATLEPEDLVHRRPPAELSPEELHAIEHLVADRTQARKERDWPRADQIRAQLDELGVQVTDSPAGPVWQLR